jgi:hypothetical protein
MDQIRNWRKGRNPIEPGASRIIPLGGISQAEGWCAQFYCKNFFYMPVVLWVLCEIMNEHRITKSVIGFIADGAELVPAPSHPDFIGYVEMGSVKGTLGFPEEI